MRTFFIDLGGYFDNTLAPLKGGFRCRHEAWEIVSGPRSEPGIQDRSSEAIMIDYVMIYDAFLIAGGESLILKTCSGMTCRLGRADQCPEIRVARLIRVTKTFTCIE